MKKSMIISSMVVVMSMICTTSFGKVVKHQPIVHSPRTEVIVVKYDHGHRHEVRPHHHDFNRHNECKVCHMTKHQIKKMEKDMQKHHSQPVTWRNTVQQPVRSYSPLLNINSKRKGILSKGQPSVFLHD